MHIRILMLSTYLALSLGTAHAEDCAKLTRMKLDHGVITSAELVSAGASTASPRGQSLPAARFDYCRVQVTSKPTFDSDIRIELWIPSGSTWNGKFEQVGNGGFAGTIPYGLMARVLSLGYAVAGTDDGHQSSESTDASWALNHPEKIKDYGWRAIDETALYSKRILRQLTAKTPSRSYFAGCSDGGREALMMAQRFPAYFDGIIAGAPAYAMTRLLTGAAVRERELGGTAAHFSAQQLALLQHQALQACAGGATYIKDPRGCHVELDTLRCAADASSPCLSQAQIDTARTFYAERKDPNGGAALYGVLPGAEAVPGSWDNWLTGNEGATSTAALGYSWNYLAYLVRHDPTFKMAAVTDADLVRGERTIGPVIDSTSADLSAFKAHGGKLIQYHGWNDPGISPGYSLEYRERVSVKTAGLRDFYRLYMVPGMLHCSGGDAPTLVDWQGALESWVEQGVPPGELTAADSHGATQVLRPVER